MRLPRPFAVQLRPAHLIRRDVFPCGDFDDRGPGHRHHAAVNHDHRIGHDRRICSTTGIQSGDDRQRRNASGDFVDLGEDLAKISSDATPSLISAPPESQSISKGQRCASANCICLMSLTPVEIVTEPAAMAESKIAVATARPCIMPCPVNKRRSPCRGSRSGRGARSSPNVPGSNRQAIFSWTVSFPWRVGVPSPGNLVVCRPRVDA